MGAKAFLHALTGPNANVSTSLSLSDSDRVSAKVEEIADGVMKMTRVERIRKRSYARMEIFLELQDEQNRDLSEALRPYVFSALMRHHPEQSVSVLEAVYEKLPQTLDYRMSSKRSRSEEVLADG